MKRTRPPFLLFQSVRERIPRCVQSTDPSARFLTGASCLLAGLLRLLTGPSARLWANSPVRHPGRVVRPTGVPALSYAGGRIVRAGHAVPKWSFRPESAVAVGPDDERGGRISGRPARRQAPQRQRIPDGRTTSVRHAPPARSGRPHTTRPAPRSAGLPGQGDALANWPKGGLTDRSRGEADRPRDRTHRSKSGPTDRSIERTGGYAPVQTETKEKGAVCASHGPLIKQGNG